MERTPQLYVTEKEIAALNTMELNSVKYEWIEDRVIRFDAPGKCFPMEHQEAFAEMLCWDLNETMHEDGSWRVVWREPVKSTWDSVTRMFRAYVPTVLEFQYLDKDGDVQCVGDTDLNIDKLLAYGMDFIKEHLTNSLAKCREMQRLLDVENLPTFSPAKGEKPTNAEEQFSQL